MLVKLAFNIIYYWKQNVQLHRISISKLLFVAGVAWAILMHPVTGYFNSWRIFVLVCGFPSLISVVCLMFLPETPKYLISRNQFEKAKSVFQKVFAFNTGKMPEEYPVSIESLKCLIFISKNISQYWLTLREFKTEHFWVLILI